MSQCPMVEKCIFFNDKMADMPETAGELKCQYCQTDHYKDCARYKVKQATGVSPETLWPIQDELVDNIINEINSKKAVD
jgi:hypothetical protein